MSYDIKFRQAALDYWKNGHSIREAAKVFSITARTLQNWKNKLIHTGTVEQLKRKTSWRKVFPELLEEYVKQHPDAFLKEIAEVFDCSDVAILYALRRLKYTRKKNYGLQRSE